MAAAALAVIQIFVMTGTRKSWPGLGSHDRDSAVVKSASAVVKSASAVVESRDGTPHPRTAGKHLTRSASGWHSIDLFRKKITPPNLLGPQWTFKGWFSKHYTLTLREGAQIIQSLVLSDNFQSFTILCFHWALKPLWRNNDQSNDHAFSGMSVLELVEVKHSK